MSSCIGMYSLMQGIIDGCLLRTGLPHRNPAVIFHKHVAVQDFSSFIKF